MSWNSNLELRHMVTTIQKYFKSVNVNYYK